MNDLTEREIHLRERCQSVHEAIAAGQTVLAAEILIIDSIESKICTCPHCGKPITIKEP